jgi:hypothetical protein
MASAKVVQELFEKKKSDETDDNTLDTGSIVRNLALYNLVRTLRKFPKKRIKLVNAYIHRCDSPSQGNNLNKLFAIMIIATVVLVSLNLVKPALANTPEVRSVVPWNDGADMKLNITIYHDEEASSHYVDNITVGVTTGTPNVFQTFPQSGPHILDQSTLTFNVTVNIGPLSDSPLAQVGAHCNIYGWGDPWTGSIPEYEVPLLLLALTGATSAFLVAKRKSRAKTTA